MAVNTFSSSDPEHKGAVAYYAGLWTSGSDGDSKAEPSGIPGLRFSRLDWEKLTDGYVKPEKPEYEESGGLAATTSTIWTVLKKGYTWAEDTLAGGLRKLAPTIGLSLGNLTKDQKDVEPFIDAMDRMLTAEGKRCDLNRLRSVRNWWAESMNPHTLDTVSKDLSDISDFSTSLRSGNTAMSTARSDILDSCTEYLNMKLYLDSQGDELKEYKTKAESRLADDPTVDALLKRTAADREERSRMTSKYIVRGTALTGLTAWSASKLGCI